MATDQLSFLITGDLAYLYDLNALSIREIGNNVRILLCNNNGGFEFSGLDKRVDRTKYVAAFDHFKDSKGWAETNGFMYIPVRSKEELDKALPFFIEKSDRPIIIEVIIPQESESEALQLLSASNWHGTVEETRKRQIKASVKGFVKDVMGNKGVDTLKKIMSKS